MQTADNFSGSTNLAPYPWQQSQWKMFISQLQQKKLSHAYLLCGPENLGKTKFAKTMANYILCSKSNPQDCNNCKNCLLIKAETHPDLAIIEPEKKNTEIKIDEVRKLNSFIYQTAKLGGSKVVIITEANKLNNFAANALLKSLEEPGAETIFILINANQSSLLPTIRSRCQKISFNLPQTKIALDYLASKISDRSQAVELLSISQGSPLYALKIHDNQENYYQDFVKNIALMFSGKKSVVEVAKIYSGKEVTTIITWLTTWIQDSIILAITANEKLLNNSNNYKIASFFASRNTIAKLFDIQNYLVEQQHLIVKNSNINKILLIEAIFCRYVELAV